VRNNISADYKNPKNGTGDTKNYYKRFLKTYRHLPLQTLHGMPPDDLACSSVISTQFRVHLIAHLQ
jgi:hypothetical protein